MLTKNPPVFAVCLTRQQLVAVRRCLIDHYAAVCSQSQSDSHDGWEEPEYGESLHDAWLVVNRIINSMP